MFLTLSLSQPTQIFLRVCLVIVAVPATFAAYTLLSSLRTYFRGLNRIPRPPLPTNPFTLLLTGHGLIRYLFIEQTQKTTNYFNSVCLSLNSTIFVLFGPLFTTNLIVMSSTAMRTVTLGPPDVFEKPPVVRRFIKTFTGSNSIFLSEGSQHRRLRNAISTALKHDNLAKLGPYFLQRGQAFTEQLVNPSNQHDPVFIIRRATFDIIIVACFGQNGIDNQVMNRLLHLFHETLHENSTFHAFMALLSITLPFIPAHWLSERERSKITLRKEVRLLCSHVIRNYNKNDKKKNKSDMNSLLSIMMDACEQGQFTTDDLEQMVQSLLLAGQATTTVSIAWTIYLLACNPDWQTRLYNELRSSWNVDDGIDALHSLPLLHRIVKESIRMYPPIQHFMRKTVQDVHIDGYDIPAGVLIRFPVAAIQSRHDVWGTDANSFNPDRFIHLDGKEETRWLWSAFWFGTHSCIGQRFALLEIKAFIAPLISKYHVSVDIARDGRPSHKGNDPTPRGLKLYYKLRASPTAS